MRVPDQRSYFYRATAPPLVSNKSLQHSSFPNFLLSVEVLIDSHQTDMSPDCSSHLSYSRNILCLHWVIKHEIKKLLPRCKILKSPKLIPNTCILIISIITSNQHFIKYFLPNPSRSINRYILNIKEKLCFIASFHFKIDFWKHIPF